MVSRSRLVSAIHWTVAVAASFAVGGLVYSFTATAVTWRFADQIPFWAHLLQHLDSAAVFSALPAIGVAFFLYGSKCIRCGSFLVGGFLTGALSWISIPLLMAAPALHHAATKFLPAFLIVSLVSLPALLNAVAGGLAGGYTAWRYLKWADQLTRHPASGNESSLA